MFVSKRRFILKTCGTTLLLKALVPLLKLARDYSGFDSIQVSAGHANGVLGHTLSLSQTQFSCLSSGVH